MLGGNFSDRNWHAGACRCMPLIHSADNVQGFLKDVIAHWDLPEDLPVFMLINSALNFIGALTQYLSVLSVTLQITAEIAENQITGFSDVVFDQHYKRNGCQVTGGDAGCSHNMEQ